MHADIELALLGLGAGATYGLMSLGLIVIFRGSGVVNFGHAALATVAGYVFLYLHAEANWAFVPSAVAGIAVSTICGVLFQWLVIRFLDDAPPFAKVLATLGLLVALQALISPIFGPSLPPAVQFLSRGTITLPFGNPKFTLVDNQLILLGIAIAASLVLWAIYKFTTFGLATTASAENQRATKLLGHYSQRLSLTNWAIGSALAGVAGILLCDVVQLTPGYFTQLMVTVLAVTLAAGFTSFTVAMVVGVLIGAGQQILLLHSQALQNATTLVGWEDFLPFVIIAVVLVLRGGKLPDRSVISFRSLPRARQSIGLRELAVILGFGCLWFWFMPTAWLNPLTTSLIGAAMCLSLVVVMGFAGQLSLSQMAFAGVGAFTAARCATSLHVPFPFPILIGALAAVPIGVVVGLPALRVRGISLGMITLGAGIVVQDILSSSVSLTGGTYGVALPAARLGPISMNGVTQPRSYGVFTLIVVLCLLFLVGLLRKSNLGMRMLAVRANERGAAAAGISVPMAKLIAFAIAAAIAGCAGGLMGYQSLQVSSDSFPYFASLTFIIYAYVGGITSSRGALIGGLIGAGGVMSQIFGTGSFSTTWLPAIAGLAVMQMVVQNPEGLVTLTERLGGYSRPLLQSAVHRVWHRADVKDAA